MNNEDPKVSDELNELIGEEELKDIAQYYSSLPKDDEENDKGSDDAPQEADEEIHESSHGLSSKAKRILSYCASGAISLCIMGAALVCAIYMPKDEDALNYAADKLRADESYIELREEYDARSAEADSLRQSAEEKKELSETLSDSENIRADLRTRIASVRDELVSLNDENTSLQSQVDELDKQIQNKIGTAITLSAGRYTVGTHIAPGRYSVTGTGNLVVASSTGESKINKTIGSGISDVILDSGDRISLNSSTKFTPSN